MTEDAMLEGKRWSEFLLPDLRGAGTGSCRRRSTGVFSEDDGEADVHSDAGDRDETYRDGHDSMLSTQSHETFETQPSYMRAKSGVEMNPDRFRQRKQIITNLPEAATAIGRVRQIAANWDPVKNGQLLGFDCVSMDPTQFKELFRRNFGVMLSARDLGILVSMYDKRGERRADSAEFLKDFWQMGRDGRELQARERTRLVQKLQMKQRARAKQRADRMSKLKEVAVGDHSERDVATAVRKITEIAARYDTARDQSFRLLEVGGDMGPTTFREQLRTIFGLRLTRREVAGLVAAFDLHRDGMIDAKEFAYRFHTLGRERRAARKAEGNLRDERARRRKREEEEVLLARMREMSKCKVNWDFSEEELARGKAIIAKAASTYDKGRLGADIERVTQMKMDPTAFRSQLQQNFRIRLGPGELGAIFTQFDKDKSMLIDGTELMHEFFRLGREERAKQLAETEHQRRKTDRRERGFRRMLENRFLEQTVAKVVWPALDHDPYEEDCSMEYCTSSSRRGSTALASRSACSLGGGSLGQAGGGREESRRRARELAEEGVEESNGRSSGRQRPKISPSTAEFIAKIEKEEMTIRAMTCKARRWGRDYDTNAKRAPHTGQGRRSAGSSSARLPATVDRSCRRDSSSSPRSETRRRIRRRSSSGGTAACSEGDDGTVPTLPGCTTSPRVVAEHLHEWAAERNHDESIAASVLDPSVSSTMSNKGRLQGSSTTAADGVRAATTAALGGHLAGENTSETSDSRREPNVGAPTTTRGSSSGRILESRGGDRRSSTASSSLDRSLLSRASSTSRGADPSDRGLSTRGSTAHSGQTFESRSSFVRDSISPRTIHEDGSCGNEASPKRDREGSWWAHDKLTGHEHQ